MIRDAEVHLGKVSENSIEIAWSSINFENGELTMCGRYVRSSDKQKISEYFHASPQPAELPPPGEDHDVAPTTFQTVIR